MFRLRISINRIDDLGIRARISSANCVKWANTTSNKWYINSDYTIGDEFRYQLIKRCKEAVRDELFLKYGKDWRKYEQPKQVMNSVRSAVKRMRLIKPR